MQLVAQQQRRAASEAAGASAQQAVTPRLIASAAGAVTPAARAAASELLATDASASPMAHMVMSLADGSSSGDELSPDAPAMVHVVSDPGPAKAAGQAKLSAASEPGVRVRGVSARPAPGSRSSLGLERKRSAMSGGQLSLQQEEDDERNGIQGEEDAYEDDWDEDDQALEGEDVPEQTGADQERVRGREATKSLGGPGAARGARPRFATQPQHGLMPQDFGEQVMEEVDVQAGEGETPSYVRSATQSARGLMAALVRPRSATQPPQAVQQGLSSRGRQQQQEEAAAPGEQGEDQEALEEAEADMVAEQQPRARGATRSAAGPAAAVARPRFATQLQADMQPLQARKSAHRNEQEDEEPAGEGEVEEEERPRMRGATRSTAGPSTGASRPRFATQPQGGTLPLQPVSGGDAEQLADDQPEAEDQDEEPVVHRRGATQSAAGRAASPSSRPRFATQPQRQFQAHEYQGVEEGQQGEAEEEAADLPVRERQGTQSAGGRSISPSGRPRFASQPQQRVQEDGLATVLEAEEGQEEASPPSAARRARGATRSTGGPPASAGRPRFATQAFGVQARVEEWTDRGADDASEEHGGQLPAPAALRPRGAIQSTAGRVAQPDRPRFASQPQAALEEDEVYSDSLEWGEEVEELEEDEQQGPQDQGSRRARGATQSTVAGAAAARAPRPRFATQAQQGVQLEALDYGQEQEDGDAGVQAPRTRPRGATQSAAGRPASTVRPRFATQPQHALRAQLQEDEEQGQGEEQAAGDELEQESAPVRVRGATQSAGGPHATSVRPRFATQVGSSVQRSQVVDGVQEVGEGAEDEQEERRLSEAQLQLLQLRTRGGTQSTTGLASAGPTRPRFATQGPGQVLGQLQHDEQSEQLEDAAHAEGSEHSGTTVDDDDAEAEYWVEGHDDVAPLASTGRLRGATKSAAGTVGGGSRPRFATQISKGMPGGVPVHELQGGVRASGASVVPSAYARRSSTAAGAALFRRDAGVSLSGMPVGAACEYIIASLDGTMASLGSGSMEPLPGGLGYRGMGAAQEEVDEAVAATAQAAATFSASPRVAPAQRDAVSLAAAAGPVAGASSEVQGKAVSSRRGTATVTAGGRNTQDSVAGAGSFDLDLANVQASTESAMSAVLRLAMRFGHSPTKDTGSELLLQGGDAGSLGAQAAGSPSVLPQAGVGSAQSTPVRPGQVLPRVPPPTPGEYEYTVCWATASTVSIIIITHLTFPHPVPCDSSLALHGSARRSAAHLPSGGGWCRWRPRVCATAGCRRAFGPGAGSAHGAGGAGEAQRRAAGETAHCGAGQTPQMCLVCSAACMSAGDRIWQAVNNTHCLVWCIILANTCWLPCFALPWCRR